MFLDLPPSKDDTIRSLSIKTIYADKIRDGSKTFELRTYCPGILPDGWCMLYESRPSQHIQTVFRAGRTFQLTPNDAWQFFEPHLGIDFDSFFTYFRKKKFAYGVEIEEVRSFDPIPLHQLREQHNFVVPQGCHYLKGSIHEQIKKVILPTTDSHKNRSFDF
jgi:predicted transcriptional regulator